jgi:hypothetical protein
MGIIRKSMSVSTMGIVSYRDKGERAAKYQKQTRNAARAQVAQNAAQLELQRQQLNALDHGNVREAARDMSPIQPMAPLVPQPVTPQGPPPGWYPDVQNLEINRWWDGVAWS